MATRGNFGLSGDEERGLTLTSWPSRLEAQQGQALASCARRAYRRDMHKVVVGGRTLTFDEVVAVAREGAGAVLSEAAADAVRKARAFVDALVDDPTPHYGVSTGFGALATRHIPLPRRVQLQRSLIRSHAAGSGPEVEREVVRGMMLLRLATMATGRTGVRLGTAESYAAMLTAGITPVVPEYGSLGCSGDLAPLAHCALAAMGEGMVRDRSGTLLAARTRSAPAGSSRSSWPRRKAWP